MNQDLQGVRKPVNLRVFKPCRKTGSVTVKGALSTVVQKQISGNKLCKKDMKHINPFSATGR